MILFIWVSIHKPQVDIVMIVNNILILRGISIKRRLFKDVVTSKILKRKDLI